MNVQITYYTYECLNVCTFHLQQEGTLPNGANFLSSQYDVPILCLWSPVLTLSAAPIRSISRTHLLLPSVFHYSLKSSNSMVGIDPDFAFQLTEMSADNSREVSKPFPSHTSHRTSCTPYNVIFNFFSFVHYDLRS